MLSDTSLNINIWLKTALWKPYVSNPSPRPHSWTPRLWAIVNVILTRLLLWGQVLRPLMPSKRCGKVKYMQLELWMKKITPSLVPSLLVTLDHWEFKTVKRYVSPQFCAELLVDLQDVDWKISCWFFATRWQKTSKACMCYSQRYLGRSSQTYCCSKDSYVVGCQLWFQTCWFPSHLWHLQIIWKRHSQPCCLKNSNKLILISTKNWFIRGLCYRQSWYLFEWSIKLINESFLVWDNPWSVQLHGSS